MRRFKRFCIGAVSLAVILAGTSAFAVEDYTLDASLTEDYIKWQSLSEEEKKNTLMPRISTFDIDYDGNNEVERIDLREQVVNGLFEKDAKVALTGANGYELSQYNLNNDINVEVKHQGITNECWAFSMTSVLETNLALTQKVNKKFSPRHMDYSSVRTFTDGINSDNLNREAGMGGLSQFAVAYLTNGKGAVLEKDMPFVDNEEKISLKELDKPVDTIATETITFPPLYKQYENGKIVYTNGGSGTSFKTYTESEVKALRDAIKNHIVKYGAISAVTAGNEIKYYSNQTEPSKSVAYFCNDSSMVRDHAVTIVGWDDNYSKENFTGVAKPQNDGAYICLNTYGTSNFDKGYLYISYEDSLIETYLYGIKSAGKIDYDKLYQYNPTGSNTSVGIPSLDKGYIAEVFDRDSSKKETLKYVGIELPYEMSLKIYVNPTGNNPVLSACKLVATTEKLSAGYHRIPIQAINLTGNKFAVVVEETSTNDRFEFCIEIAVKDSIYSTIEGNPGKSMYSLNGYSWNEISNEKVDGFDMSTADLTIKAFTANESVGEQNPETQNPTPQEPDDKEKEPENPPKEEEITLTSEKYTLKGTDIYSIDAKTTAKQFKENIKTNSKTIEILDREDKKIEDSEYIKTGSKLKISNGTTYTLIVKGDTNCDGENDLVDLSRVVAHYGDTKNNELTGYLFKAGDLNIDGKINLVDLSRLVNIIGHL